MKIDKFKVEEWFNKYEYKAVYDLADTCVESLSVDELLEIAGKNKEDLSEIYTIKLNYGNIHGSEKLKKLVANLYKKQTENNITITVSSFLKLISGIVFDLWKEMHLS